MMTLDPLLDAPADIKLHVAAIAVALVLAPVQLALPKGTPRHRLVGWIWAAAMVLACVSALAILDRPIAPRFGPLSWLHLLAVFTYKRPEYGGCGCNLLRSRAGSMTTTFSAPAMASTNAGPGRSYR